ncbi:hypothetical protein [uncultured Alistipes sp.]|uniref:hypothetical protein n=1 Tax=uncultured Alistipes sp. TaxID=538949 RepID=UPI0025D0456E|nr:hypothetical protein [uncultured Alistipes sp.]
MRHNSPSKFLYLSVVLLFSFLTGYSQEAIVMKYLERAGDHAIAYSGEIGTIYNPQFFSNTPYYNSSEYASGVIYFQQTCYPNQQLKIDLHRDELILLSPQRHGVIVDPRAVKSVHVHDKEFIWLTPTAKNGMATGYYIRLAHGKEVQFLCRYSFHLQTRYDKVQRHFSESQRYYILYNGTYYSVSSRSSFDKIFPSLKKQMKAFEKATKHEYAGITDRVLKKEQRLARLAIFCDESLSKQAQP